MKKKRIILSLSGIGILSIVGLTCYLNSGTFISKNSPTENSVSNTIIESKEEKIVNDKLTEIFKQPLIVNNEKDLQVEEFVEEIKIAQEEDKVIENITTNDSTPATPEDNKESNDVLNQKENKEKVEIKDEESIIETPIIEDKKDETIIEEETTTDLNKEEEKIEEVINDSEDKKDSEEIIENEEELQVTYLQPSTPILGNIISTSTGLTINFEKSINAEKYICKYGTSVDKLDKDGSVIETLNGYQCFINDLNQGTTYYVSIEAINGPYRVSSEIKSTKTSYMAPEKQNLISSVVTADSIKLNYTISKNASRYTCYYKTSDSSTWNLSGNTVINKDNIYCEINDLEENNKYDVKIIAINGDKMVESEINSFVTDYKKPSVPVIKHIVTDKNDVKIIFDKSANATSYICRYGLNKESLNKFGSVTITTNEVECNLSGLSPNTRYSVEIIAYNHSVSNSLDVFETTTNQLVELSTPVLIDTISNSSEIDTTFNIYLGNPNEFTCSYGTDKDNLNRKGQIIDKTNSMATCRMSNLTEGATYYVSLTAKNEDFEKTSDIYTVKTNYITPTKSKLNGFEVSENSIIANFEKTSNTSKYICYYGTSNSNLNLQGTVSEENNLVKCSIDKLNQGTEYYVKIVSTNGDKINSSDIYTISTDTIKPEIPVVVNTSKTSHSIDISYSLSKYAIEYKGYYGDAENNLIEVPIIKTDDKITISAKNLQDSTNYFFKLEAINKDKKSSSETTIVKTFNEDINKPIVSSVSTTDSIINVNYTVEDNLDLYMCYYGTSENNLNQSINAIKTSDNTRQCSANNLNENSTYFFKLNVIKNNTIVNSDTESYKTQYKTPSVPVVQSKNSTNTSFVMNFNIDSNVKNYSCKMGSEANNLNTVIKAVRDGNTITCEANELLNKTDYFVQLEVSNGDKKAYSNVETITTRYDVPSKPVFMGESKTNSQIVASYGLSENTTGYICYIGTNITDLTTLGNVEVKSDRVTCTFNGLSQGKNYYYKVVSTNNNEIFVDSDIKMTTTDFNTPDKPVVKDIYNTDNSISLTYPLSSYADSYSCKYGASDKALVNTGTVSVSLANTVVCEATGLEEDSNYFFQLTAINGNKTNVSDIVRVKTTIKESEEPLGTPEFVSMGAKTNNSVSLNFTKIENAYTHYCYYGATQNNLTFKTKANYVDGYAQCQISNIDTTSDLYVKVRAYKQDGTTYTESAVKKVDGVSYIPEAPVLKETVKDFENIINTYNTGGYTNGYKCYIGTSESNMKDTGVFAAHGSTQYCAYTGLQPGTTYYTKIVNTFGSNSTPSQTSIIKTDNLNGCMGTGPNTTNLSDYTTKVNSTCAVKDGDKLALNAEEVAIQLASVDALKVLKDYPDYDFKSLAEVYPIYNPDRTISGYYVDTIMYTPGNMADVIGEYNLYKNLKRFWIQDLY